MVLLTGTWHKPRAQNHSCHSSCLLVWQRPALRISCFLPCLLPGTLCPPSPPPKADCLRHRCRGLHNNSDLCRGDQCFIDLAQRYTPATNYTPPLTLRM